MRIIIYILLVCSIVYTQDFNNDGFIEFNINKTYDLNGDGIKDYNFFQNYSSKYIPPEILFSDNILMNFSQLWQSPPGAFSNCWDGYIGYIDNDTLLDIAGFTFSPAKFYIWEQSPVRPDSFYIVQEFIKAEGGSFGPIAVGDSDGDGKLEIIAADVLGIARIYIYENNGNNIYIDQNTQTTLVHPSNGEGGQGIYLADLNKNGKKEIILIRGASSGGEVRIWEHSGSIGNHVYTNIYTYSTVTYLFGKGGLGDGDNDGWDEIYLTYGGFPTFNTFIRRIEFDSASNSFQHLQFEAPSVGFPANYRTYDLGNDNVKELIMSGNSNNRASAYIFRNNGQNSFIKLDSIFESSDNNNMLSSDIKILNGNTNPVLLLGSFNGRIYTYTYDGSTFVKDYENLNYPGPAIRRVYWLPVASYDGYFNTWSSSSSNGTYYIFKRDDLIGISGNQTPAEYILKQNYPNPFNPVTSIEFKLSVPGFINLSVYNYIGKQIETLLNRYLVAGNYLLKWDGTNFPSGVYFYNLTSENTSETKKMILLK